MGRRKRSNSWIQRWSRPLIAGVAGFGALTTGYLTIVKLTGGAAACPTSGCDQVLSSPYAMIFGLPLTLFGFLAYMTMAGLALAPLAVDPVAQKQQRAKVEEWTWLLLFAGAIAMVVFSGYLIYLLAFQIQALCLYCLASALFTAILLGLTLVGRDWSDLGQLLLVGTVVGITVLTSSLGMYASSSPSVALAAGAGIAGPTITTVSNPGQMALAEHLKQIDAKMYGAYWCPHCHDQKQLFGRPAFAKITYIECAPEGQNAQPDRCDAAGIQGYPTWEINGQYYSGSQSLAELARLSGYSGSQEF
jgi:uncharacterized membrane protein